MNSSKSDPSCCFFLQKQYETLDYVEKSQKFDLRSIPDRVKRFIIHDQSIIDVRLSECNNCEFFLKATSQCKKCGCFMKLKSRLSTMQCPIGKWGKEANLIKDKNATPATI